MTSSKWLSKPLSFGLPIELCSQSKTHSAAQFIETTTSPSQKEYLTWVISHPQALAQCELTLTKLGLNIAHEAIDDMVGVVEFVVANNLRDSQRTRLGSLRDEHLDDGI